RTGASAGSAARGCLAADRFWAVSYGYWLLLLFIEPLLVRLEAERPSEEVAHQRRRRLRSARCQDRVAVLPRDRRREQVRPIELAEEVLRDDERPHVRVVDGRIAIQVPERRLEVGALDERIG